MKGHFISVVVGLSVVFIVIGLLVGNIPWVALVGSIIGFSIAELVRNRKINKDEMVEASNDERIANNLQQFMGGALFLSFGVLFLYLIIAKYVSDISVVHIDYLIMYVVVTFFVVITGGSIVKKR